MARMTAPNGAPVTVPDGKVDNLTRHGFTVVKEVKSTPKKTSSEKSKK